MSLLHKTCIQLTLLSSLAVPARPSHAGSSGPSTGATTRTVVQTAPSSTAATSVGDAPASAVITEATRLTALSANASRSTEPVLVVPSKEAEARSFDPLAEDLSIMSRIIQKSLADGYLLPEISAMDSLIMNLGMPSRNLGPRLFFPASRRLKPMYLGGYGALFFLQVDFPLLPPAQKAEAAPAEKVDPVWAETRRALYKPQAAMLPDGTPPAEPYSEEKVQMLKGRLTEVMRHATNIRVLDPNEWVAIVVRGTLAPGASQAQYPPDNADAEPVAVCGRTIVTLRARKADIDQFAKGQLDPAQFEQHLQFATSKQ
jgi:hypothetical protein